MAPLTLAKGRRRAVLGLAATAAASALLLAGCSADTSSSSSGKPDDGTKLTMWARPDNGPTAQLLVDEYNKTHKNVVKLTLVPSASFQAKVGAAAGSGGLPDILGADVVYSPNYVKQGLYKDITSAVKGLPYYDSLSHAHTDATTLDGKIYGTPLVVDSSLIIYNKDLFTKAGLDPEQGPSSFDEIYTDAKAIRDKVGGDTYGFYFGGNCAGCNAYTMFPYAVAAGSPPFTDDGKKGDFDSKAMTATLDLYKKMYDEGIIPASAKEEDGSSWTTAFNAGQIGILPVGTFDFGNLAKANFDWGVAGLPAPDGGKTATFVGGDVAGITKDSKHYAQALDFLKWTLGKDAQVNVLAKSGNLPSRVDLADNEYSSKDPRIVQTIKGLATGYTPSSIAYGAVINAPTGPWSTLVRDYVFNGKTDAVAAGQKAIQAGIDQAK
ncbi:sugar ABC transporter substrate-binding protein [Glaciibacter flavus]|uniref:Sugar ABC transporter substrate-binding protein n=1 Tax=Orlajensenia flava TaxID=2565934 RepID=A0A4S4FUS3_9MICO|nr:sugar ABC transporter substrate-binding protein [Glaciibacter flavus]THG34038.1 sugar ABC transporter substrate-binding protein [Glaciibacter flavus]